MRVRGLFPAHLAGSRIESGDRPIHLPKLDIVAVDELLGTGDGGVIVAAIQLDHADRPVVSSDDQCTVSGHFDLQVMCQS